MDKGMVYAAKYGHFTPAHNDQSCDQTIHATVAGAKHWRLYLGDVLEKKLSRMQSKGYAGVPHSSKDSPWVGTVMPGEILVFNQAMIHEVRYLGEARDWGGYNIGVTFHFTKLQSLFFHDAFWDEMLEMQNGKYFMCRNLWDSSQR